MTTVTTKREDEIFQGYKDGLTLQVIGNKLGISRERVRQIVNNILYREIEERNNSGEVINLQEFISKVKEDHFKQGLINNFGSIRRYRFQKLAKRRLDAISERLRIFGNCANRHDYEYSEEDIDRMFAEIRIKVKEARAKFHFLKEKEFKL